MNKIFIQKNFVMKYYHLGMSNFIKKKGYTKYLNVKIKKFKILQNSIAYYSKVRKNRFK